MSTDDLTLQEFRDAISQIRIKQMMLISFAIVFGATLFAVVAGLVKKDSDSDLMILQYVNFGMTFMCLMMSVVVPGLVLKLAGSNKGMTPEQIINKIQAAHLVRLALVEGAALFGCVCVLLGIGYINYISLVPLYLTLFMNLPTEKMICRQFIVYFKQDNRLLLEIE